MPSIIDHCTLTKINRIVSSTWWWSFNKDFYKTIISIHRDSEIYVYDPVFMEIDIEDICLITYINIINYNGYPISFDERRRLYNYIVTSIIYQYEAHGESSSPLILKTLKEQRF